MFDIGCTYIYLSPIRNLAQHTPMHTSTHTRTHTQTHKQERTHTGTPHIHTHTHTHIMREMGGENFVWVHSHTHERATDFNIYTAALVESCDLC